jgi:hypothetical protein
VQSGRERTPELSIKALQTRDRPTWCVRRVGEMRQVGIFEPRVKETAQPQQLWLVFDGSDPVPKRHVPGVGLEHGFTLRLRGDPDEGYSCGVFLLLLAGTFELKLPQF